MLCRHHVHLAGFCYRASQLACRVHDVIPQQLRNVHERSDNCLVLARLRLVEKCVLELVVRDFGAVTRCTSRLAVRHPEPFKDRFAVCLLGNSQGTCLAIPLDFHSEYERCFPHVGHFEALLQLPFHHQNGVRVVAGQEKVIDVESQVDLGPVVIVQIHARV